MFVRRCSGASVNVRLNPSRSTEKMKSLEEDWLKSTTSSDKGGSKSHSQRQSKFRRRLRPRRFKRKEKKRCSENSSPLPVQRCCSQTEDTPGATLPSFICSSDEFSSNPLVFLLSLGALSNSYNSLCFFSFFFPPSKFERSSLLH